MSHPKLFRRLTERKKPVTVYLSREAFERGVDGHLAYAYTSARAHAVLQLRLSSYASIYTLVGADAARELLRKTGSTLLRISDIVAAVYLGEGTFAVLLSDAQPSEAELHANFLVYSIDDLRLHMDDMTLSCGAFAGLAIAGEGMDGKTLLAAAEHARRTAEAAGGGRSQVMCAEQRAECEVQERIVPECQIAEICMDSDSYAPLLLN